MDSYRSYIHCEWKNKVELESGDKRAAAKIKRFLQKRSHSSDQVFRFLSFHICAVIFWQFFLILPKKNFRKKSILIVILLLLKEYWI